jgi:hypothetical protein
MNERDTATTRMAEGPRRRNDPATDPTWTPGTLVTEEERWTAGLRNEVRPLVERCRRLRDRGLLD